MIIRKVGIKGEPFYRASLHPDDGADMVAVLHIDDAADLFCMPDLHARLKAHGSITLGWREV